VNLEELREQLEALPASAQHANVVMRTGEDTDLKVTAIRYDQGEVIIEAYEAQEIYP
jgi:hypothetical protein